MSVEAYYQGSSFLDFFCLDSGQGKHTSIFFKPLFPIVFFCLSKMTKYNYYAHLSRFNIDNSSVLNKQH